MSIKVTILSTGTCALTGKKCNDGLTVSFEDATLRESILSWKGFRQVLGMKTGAPGKPPAKSGKSGDPEPRP